MSFSNKFQFYRWKIAKTSESLLGVKYKNERILNLPDKTNLLIHVYAYIIYFLQGEKLKNREFPDITNFVATTDFDIL